MSGTDAIIGRWDLANTDNFVSEYYVSGARPASVLVCLCYALTQGCRMLIC